MHNERRLKNMKNNSQKKDNKGVFGLTSVKGFIAILLTIAILAFLTIVIVYNLSNANVLPSGTYASNTSNTIFNNVTSGLATLFSYSGTWFTLLAVIVLVLIVVVALVVISSRALVSGGSESGSASL